MINYIENKKISFKRVEKILFKSKKINHYSNNGPTKIALEKKIEKLLNINEKKRVICTNNGTAALHALMMLCQSKGLTKFVSPAFTFPSVNVGNRGGNTTILDIDLNTCTLPLDKILLQHYDVIIITNLFGTYTNIPEWIDFCEKENKILIFDNASSPMSKYQKINICNFGHYSFGSLHHTKYLGFGEGGFIIAPEDEYNSINSILNFGFYDNKQYDKLSSNFKMSDISAAFILQHLERYDMNKHIKNQKYLITHINNITNVQILNYNHNVVYGNLPVLFDTNADQSYFKNLQIEANKYYKPLSNCKNSNTIYNRIINFPLNQSLTKKQMNIIINAIKLYTKSI